MTKGERRKKLFWRLTQSSLVKVDWFAGKDRFCESDGQGKKIACFKNWFILRKYSAKYVLNADFCSKIAC
jgi:hypothetical protein